MKTTARVVAVQGNFATVESSRVSACEGCHKATEGEGCSVCSLMGSGRTISARADNRIGAAVGDTVVIESRTGRMLWYAAMVFLLPLLTALAAYGISTLITERILWHAVSALIGFVGAFLGVWFYSKRVSATRSDIVITEIVNRTEGLND